LEQYCLESLTSKITAPESGVLVGQIDGELAGIASYGPLPWESGILGQKAMSLNLITGSSSTGRIRARLSETIAEAINILRIRGAELVTTKTYTTETCAVHALEKHGFLLMDTVVEATYRYKSNKLPPRDPRPDGFSFRAATSSDIEELRRVSNAAFAHHFGRFHADPMIGKEMGTRIYEEWIQACVEGWGDWIILAENEGRIVGFSVWKKPSALELRYNLKVGHYSIGAIHPDFFGRGLFKRLTAEGMHLLKDCAEFIEGPTHIHNLPVQRGYLKLGWQIVDSRHSFHKWIK